jgi:hypothetical protein
MTSTKNVNNLSYFINGDKIKHENNNDYTGLIDNVIKKPERARSRLGRWTSPLLHSFRIARRWCVLSLLSRRFGDLSFQT